MMVGEIHGQHSCEVEDNACLNPLVNYEEFFSSLDLIRYNISEIIQKLVL